MERTAKILFACLGVVIVLGAAALGTVFGMHLAHTRSAAQPTQSETTAQTTERAAETLTETVLTEETATAAPTEPETTAAATEPETTAASTAKATTLPSVRATTLPTTARRTTQAATTRAATTQAPTAAPTAARASTTAARRSGTYTLRVVADSGTTEVTGGGRYDAGEIVKVSMTPLLGHTFLRWDSSDEALLADGKTQTYSFRMPASDMTLRAVTFVRPQVTLSKGKGVASVSGARYYSPGDRVTVSAKMLPGYDFAFWRSSPCGLDSTARSYTFIMPDHSVTLTANGVPKTYNVRVTLGKGVRGVSGDGGHKVGEKVTVRAKLYDDYAFDHWEGFGGVYRDEVYTFTMPAENVSLTATAVQKPKFLLTVDKGPGIESVGGGGKHVVGSSVTVTCVPERGYTFVTWLSSDSSLVRDSFHKNYTFTMPDADVALTAYAEKTKYKVTLKKGAGIAAVQGEGTFTAGETVTVDCTLMDGYTFSEWSVAGRITVPDGKTQKYTFIMPDSDIALTAKAAADSGGSS